MDISDLELSTRTLTLMKNNGVTSVDTFMALDSATVRGWINSGQRTWNEIRDVQRSIVQSRRRTSLPGKAAALVFQLNEMRSALGAEGFFIGRTENGLLRLYREVKKEDFDAPV